MNHPGVWVALRKPWEYFDRFEVVLKRSFVVLEVVQEFEEIWVSDCIWDVVFSHLRLPELYRLQEPLLELVSLAQAELNLSLLFKQSGQSGNVMVFLGLFLNDFL